MDERFRDFDAAIDEQDPLTFKLGGREWVVDDVSAASFLRYTRRLAEHGQSLAGMTNEFHDFLLGALREEDREDFETMLTDKKVPFPHLRNVVNWLIEEATGVPFVAPSSSAESPSTSGGPPRLVSLSGTPTSEGSASAAG
jgi:hypothetical protein